MIAISTLLSIYGPVRRHVTKNNTEKIRNATACNAAPLTFKSKRACICRGFRNIELVNSAGRREDGGDRRVLPKKETFGSCGVSQSLHVLARPLSY